MTTEHEPSRAPDEATTAATTTIDEIDGVTAAEESSETETPARDGCRASRADRGHGPRARSPRRSTRPRSSRPPTETDVDETPSMTCRPRAETEIVETADEIEVADTAETADTADGAETSDVVEDVVETLDESEVTADQIEAVAASVDVVESTPDRGRSGCDRAGRHQRGRGTPISSTRSGSDRGTQRG